MKVSTTKNGSYKDALFKLQYLYKPKPMSKIPFTVKKVIRQKRNEYADNNLITNSIISPLTLDTEKIKSILPCEYQNDQPLNIFDGNDQNKCN